MPQLSFGDSEYGHKRKRTRRETFLAEMEEVVPWGSLLALIEPPLSQGRQGPASVSDYGDVAHPFDAELVWLQ